MRLIAPACFSVVDTISEISYVVVSLTSLRSDSSVPPAPPPSGKLLATVTLPFVPERLSVISLEVCVFTTRPSGSNLRSVFTSWTRSISIERFTRAFPEPTRASKRLSKLLFNFVSRAVSPLPPSTAVPETPGPVSTP